MKLVVNVTKYGASVGDSQIEEGLRTFISWMKRELEEDDDYHPNDFVGEEHTHPLTKVNEETFDYRDCDEWQIDVDSELTLLVALTLLSEGVIPEDGLKIKREDKLHPIDVDSPLNKQLYTFFFYCKRVSNVMQSKLQAFLI